MFRNVSISLRFVIATVLAVAVVLIAMQVVTVTYLEKTLTVAEKNEMAGIHQNIVSRIEFEGKAAQMASALVGGIPQVQKAFAEQQRDVLASYFVPAFNELKDNYGVRQFQFHKPPATSFLRVHKPEKFGDDLSSFRLTVVRGNQMKEPIQGMEVGVAGLGIRGLVPVSYRGSHVGTVEFGMSFDQSFFDDYTRQNRVDLAFYLNRNQRFELFAETMSGQSLLNPKELSSVSLQSSLFKKARLSDKPVSVYAATVTDYSGDPIGVLVIAKDRSEFVKANRLLVTQVTLVGLFSISVIGVMVWLISLGVVRPVRYAASVMESITSEEGSLTVRLDEQGKDEVARFCRAYNRFADKTEGMIDSVSEVSSDLSAPIDKLATLSEHTVVSIDRQHEKTESVAAATAEMAATVQEISKNTTHTAEAAKEADQSSRAGRDVVDQATESIKSLATEIGRAVETVGRVSNDSERIGSVLNVIRSIADQTNLLALNAAIEAARAGEQGRGFAVVADEVRTLAQRTQDSTQEIQEMIANLQSGVQQTVQVMQSSQAQASVSVEQVNQANAALNDILAAIDTITQMSTQVATATEEQNAVAEEVSRDLAELSTLVSESAVDSKDSHQAVETMISSVDHVHRLLGGFQTSRANVLHLKRAIASHVSWKLKVRGFLDGKGTLDEKVAFNSNECGFGKWYDSIGKVEFADIPEIQQIEKPHRDLHALIHQIHQLKQSGDQEGAEREYERIGPLSDRIIELMTAIVQKI